MSRDLDARRAARREAHQEAPTLTFGGETYELPFELPMTAVDNLSAMYAAGKAKDNDAASAAILAVISDLLGDGFAAFLAWKPSMQDLKETVDDILSQYGFDDMGESEGSETSSEDTSEPSKQTSEPSTV